MATNLPATVCGKAFDINQLKRIREITETAEPRQRAEITRRVCAELGWHDSRGKPKLMGGRVALLRLYRQGWIALPAPVRGNGNGKGLVHQRLRLPSEKPLECQLADLGKITLKRVASRSDSALYNAMMDAHHYLGYQPLVGAHPWQYQKPRIV